MGSGLYINICDTGDIHCGVYMNRDYKVYRTLQKGTFGKIKSCLEVFLNDSVALSWNEINKAIDEFYLKIGTPKNNNVYSEKTSNGKVELLSGGDFAINAEDAKSEAHIAADFALRLGNKITLT